MPVIRPFDIDFELDSPASIVTTTSEDPSPNVRKISIPDIMEELE